MFRFFEKKWPHVQFDEIRRRSRLLVIDDQEFPYKSLFERDGYTIEKWDDVEDLSRLESGAFDLILLDLQGIGGHESAEQGVGILKHLRRRCPSQIIVAYSSAEFGLQYQEFFSLADSVLPKTADYVDFKDEVDNLLEDRFSFGFYTSRIATEVKKYGVDRTDLDKATRAAILRNKPGKLEALLGKHGATEQEIDRVLSIVNTAIGIAQLWNM